MFYDKTTIRLAILRLKRYGNWRQLVMSLGHGVTKEYSLVGAKIRGMETEDTVSYGVRDVSRLEQ